MTVKTFDPGQIACVLGPNIISGFAPDSVVEVARNEDTWTTLVGADGEVTRSRNRNKSGTVKFKLARTSQSNDVLSALHAQDELFGTGILPVTIKDLLGTTIHFGANAWVQKPADDSIEQESGDREWTLAVGDLDMFSGGSVISAA